MKKVLDEANSTTTIDDVDKFHRVGPKKDDEQDIIVRFRSHTAKENVYHKRKSVR